jgi:hypothetical protein
MDYITYKSITGITFIIAFMLSLINLLASKTL